MTNAERYQKYIDEHCKNCKHRDEDLCDIRISVLDNVVTTKCVFYEKEEVRREKKKLLYTIASKSKPLMKGLV